MNIYDSEIGKSFFPFYLNGNGKSRSAINITSSGFYRYIFLHLSIYFKVDLKKNTVDFDIEVWSYVDYFEQNKINMQQDLFLKKLLVNKNSKLSICMWFNTYPVLMISDKTHTLKNNTTGFEPATLHLLLVGTPLPTEEHDGDSN